MYLSPYLTCKECNAVNAVNINLLGSLHDSLDLKSPNRFQPEQLPECVGCRTTLHLTVGVKDFKEDQAFQLNLRKENQRKLENAAKLVQRVFRGYRDRNRVFDILEAERKWRWARNVAATKVQSIYRGNVGRKVTMVQSALTLIQEASCIARDQVVKNKYPSLCKRVFWYEEVMLEVLYRDYRELVQRTGYVPSLINVENNILTIARRILKFENDMATMIQLKWRSIASVLVVRCVLRNQCYVRDMRESSVRKIQAFVRGQFGRTRHFKHRVTVVKAKWMQDYKQERLHKNTITAQQNITKKSMATFHNVSQRRLMGRASGRTRYQLSFHEFEQEQSNPKSTVATEFAHEFNTLMQNKSNRLAQLQQTQSMVRNKCNKNELYKLYFSPSLQTNNAVDVQPKRIAKTFKQLQAADVAKIVRRNRRKYVLQPL